MKMKNDFITNSSSTSYIVFIPDNFDIDEYLDKMERENLFEYFDRYIENHCDDILIDDYKREIRDAFYELINDSVLYEFDISCEIFYEIITILNLNNIIVNSNDVSSDDGVMININSKRLKERIDEIKRSFNHEN